MTAAILIGVMAVATMLLRFLPFIVFGKDTPGYISYLGRVLPQAIIGLFKRCFFVGASIRSP